MTAALWIFIGLLVLANGGVLLIGLLRARRARQADDKPVLFV